MSSTAASATRIGIEDDDEKKRLRRCSTSAVAKQDGVSSCFVTVVVKMERQRERGERGKAHAAAASPSGQKGREREVRENKRDGELGFTGLS